MRSLISFLGDEKIKITSKFAFLFIIVGLIPLSISGTISYFIYQRNIREMTIESAVSSVETINNEVQNLYEECERFLDIGATQWPLLFIETNESSLNYSEELLKVFNYYRQGIQYDRLISNSYVIGLNGKCLSEKNGVYYKTPEFILDNEYLSRVLFSDEGVVIIPEHISDYDQEPSIEPTISIGRILYNNTTSKPIGIVIVDLNPKEIQKVYMDFSFIGDGRVSLIYANLPPDNLPAIVAWEWYNIKELFNTDSEYFTLRIDHDQFLFVFSNTKYQNLRLLGTVHVNELFSGVRIVRNYTLFSLVFSAFLIFMVYLVIVRGLVRPLEEIQNNMQEASEGHLRIEINYYKGDMISGLKRSFEKMLVDLRNYIATIDEEHRKYVDAEMRVLQEQINPHFLYNTLDTILWSAVARGNDEIVELTSEMSKFFRLSLSKGADYVMLKHEIECITSYLNIQKIRYHEILDFDILVEEDILDCRVLKLILQPLVENALYHGIKSKRTKGKITVTVKKSGRMLLFSVADDGLGIKEDRLNELRRYLADPDKYMGYDNVGVGLLNVQHRILLRYGGESQINIESDIQQGTRIYFKLPVI